MTQKQELAIIFPGQGAQVVGMLADVAATTVTVQSTFDEASSVLGYDLWQVVQQGPQDKLNMTEVTQPALLVSSVALWRVWRERGGSEPGYVTGHSLGEWSALVCAGVVDFADAVKLVRARGRYMQEAVPVGEGAMAAIIGLDDASVEEACRKAAEGDVVAPVNYNSPGQLVIAGHAGAVERAVERCKAAGAKRGLLLPVSAPFHTSLMQPAADKLAADVEAVTFHAPRFPVVHNVHADTETDQDRIKALIIQQIYSPVQWVACVKRLVELGTKVTLECGPGKVLSGLNRRIDRDLLALVTENDAALRDSLGKVG